MNIKYDIHAGGVFSKMAFYMFNDALHNANEVYLNSIDPWTNGNAFNFVFDQPDIDDTFVEVTAEHLGNHTAKNPIETSPSFGLYIRALNKLKFNSQMTSMIADNSHLARPLGVHVRLTDMNKTHPEYGSQTIGGYIDAIRTEQPESVFLASDNIQAIQEIKEALDVDVSYVHGTMRTERADDDIIQFQIDKLKDEDMWRQVFLDVILLSMSDTIIGRTSGVFNAAIVYSGGGKRYVRI